MNPFARPAFTPTAIAMACLSLAIATAQDPPPPPEDPSTGGQEKGMQALGIVTYGPLKWADNLSTTDVDRVLGESRILWIETEHFRIGSTLKTVGIPDDVEARKDLQEECARLNKKWSKLAKRPKKLEPWYRLHLFAQRAEDMYADLAELVGSKDGSTAGGKYLGLPDKYLILLFEKKSDLIRYADRFCGRNVGGSMRHYHDKSRQESVMSTAEADPPHDEPALHSQVRYMLAGALVDGLDGRISSTPEWLRLGLSHFYERQISTNLITVTMHDDERIDGQTQHLWREKMLARAQHESLLIPFEKLVADTDLGYYANVQAWSRVEYLRQLDPHKLGAYLMACKRNPSASRQLQGLEELFGFDATTFDTKWREWVLKTYK